MREKNLFTTKKPVKLADLVNGCLRYSNGKRCFGAFIPGVVHHAGLACAPHVRITLPDGYSCLYLFTLFSPFTRSSLNFV